MRILDYIFPRRCLGCGKIKTYFCNSCQKTIVPLHFLKCPVCRKPAIGGETHPRCRGRYQIDGLTSFFRYDGLIREAVKTLKYRLVTDLAGDLINLVSDRDFRDLKKYLFSKHLKIVIIPVPLHDSRYRSRGFNQAEVIGKLIADKLDAKLINNLLYRVKITKPQIEMKSREDRLKNIKNAFSVNKLAIGQFNNYAIILIDDVFTTGATIRDAANQLKRNGVKFIWGITLAQ